MNEQISSAIRRSKSFHAVRWYILMLPSCHRGGAERGLRSELERRLRQGEPGFEYFAPKYVEVRNENGRLVRTERPLLYNYVFVRSSESEICKMRRGLLSAYNFLPRMGNCAEGAHPYLPDAVMRNFRWVAAGYSNVLPVYLHEPGRLAEGDRIRITEGVFEGVEATVLPRPGGGGKELVVSVGGWMWIPLTQVQPGQYEIIGLSEAGRHVYTRLDNDRIWNGLHEALLHRQAPGGTSRQEVSLAEEVLRTYAGVRLESAALRCKQAALLLMAHTVLGHREEGHELVGASETMLPLLRSESSRALLLVVLYGCTDNSIFYHAAHELLTPWRGEPSLKRSKQRLLQWLDDYDRCYHHEG